MSSKEFISKSPQDQKELCEYLKNLKDLYKIFAFYGEMGAGKTTLIKNICNFLEVKDNVSSPTYSLVNEYETLKGDLIYHFDFYRIKNKQEALDMGCEEYFYSNNLCLIEWPEMLGEILPESHIKIDITLKNELRVINATLSK